MVTPMRNYVLFEIETESLSSFTIERSVMVDVSQKLRDSGTRCSKIKGVLPFVCCRLQRSVVAVGVMASARTLSPYARCSIQCGPYLPLWRRLLRRIYANTARSEESVRVASDKVDKILAADSRIRNVRWVSREDWHRWCIEEGAPPIL